MKKSKLVLLWVLTFAAGLVCGGSVVWYFTSAAARACSCRACPACPVSADLLLAQLEEAGLPDNMQEMAADHAPKSSADLPSQLVRSDLPEDVVLGGEVAPAAETEKPSGVVLSDGQNTVVLNSQRPAQRAADGTSITMIEAPVAVKRIKTLDDYKAFKRTALGSYPTADFAQEEVIVLESQSNLPDKVFEIVSVEPDGENLKLRYRVNVFGLDKKTNTHSAQKISKTKANIILEQVL